MDNTPASYASAAGVFEQAAGIFDLFGVSERAAICRAWRDEALAAARLAQDVAQVSESAAPGGGHGSARKVRRGRRRVGPCTAAAIGPVR